jgi:hypothetical protein
MLQRALNFLAYELQGSFPGQSKPDSFTPQVVPGNLMRFNHLPSNNNQLVVTLLNISEEPFIKNTLLNPDRATNKGGKDSIFINLNLQLLFTAMIDDYEKALQTISHTIRFFQASPEFLLKGIQSDENQDVDNVKIMMYLQTLTLEEVYQLKSSTGGNYQPFVCYKMRLSKGT